MDGGRWVPRSYPASPGETPRSQRLVTESPALAPSLPSTTAVPERQQAPGALQPAQTLTLRDTPGTLRSVSVSGQAPSPSLDRGFFRISAAYQVMYADMSWRFVNANYASTGILHGPSLGMGWGPWSLSFSFLTSDAWSGEARDVTPAGLGYLRKETLQRRDYEILLGRELIPDRRPVALEGLMGFIYTDLPEIKSRYFLDDGNFFGLDGSMRIWGPMAGLKLTIPLGSPQKSPFTLNLSGLAMYLTAEGRHDQSLPPTGVALNSVGEGKAFNASGWGGRIDANLDWNLFRGLHAVIGARIQSSSLRDNGIDGSTIRASNGLFGAYGSVMYGW